MVVNATTEPSLAATYGSFRRSREVGKIFETYQVLPDFTYYYSEIVVHVPDQAPFIEQG
jgi:hypothetical protein